MRQDMFKVIVERPRRKGHSHKGKNRRKDYDRQNTQGAAWDPEVYDEPRNWETIRPKGRGTERKELNENLNPLWAFLGSRVGQPWDEVYSEIREHLSPKNAVQMHVVQHLKMGVEEAAWMGEDGRVYDGFKYRSSYSKPACLEEDGYGRHNYYVHPVTRVLCVQGRTVHPGRVRAKAKPDSFRITDLAQYRKINGAWCVVNFEKIPRSLGTKARYGDPYNKFFEPSLFESYVSYDGIGDILFPDGMTDRERFYRYGFCNIRAISARPLGRRELRHIKTLPGYTPGDEAQ